MIAAVDSPVSRRPLAARILLGRNPRLRKGVRIPGLARLSRFVNGGGVAPQPPVITTVSLPDADEDQAYSEALAATGQVDQWSIQDGVLPAGLSLDSSTGHIDGTPTEAGTFNFTVRATGPGGFDDAELSLTVIPAPPQITTTDLPDATEGQAYSEALAATGQVDDWSIQDGVLPAGLALNTATGEISGTPTETGTFQFTVRAENTGGFDDAELSLTVNEPPFDPNTLADTLLLHNLAESGEFTPGTGANVDAWANRGTGDTQWIGQAAKPQFDADYQGLGLPAMVLVAANVAFHGRDGANANNTPLSAVWNASAMVYIAVVNAASGVTGISFGDLGDWVNCRNDNAGTEFQMDVFGGGLKQAPLARQTDAWAIYAWKIDGGKLYKSLNGAAWDAGVAISAIGALTGQITMGSGPTYSNGFGAIHRQIAHNAIPAGLDAYLASLAAWYGVS